MIATRVKDQIELKFVQQVGPEFCAGVSVDTYADVAALPKVISYEGRTYAFTGWNSDMGIAYFKTGARLADVGGAK